MKPNFALTLSFDGIGLLHRSETGWMSVWDVKLNDPDLAGALQSVITKAKDLEPSGITSKVVIPNQQIRYLTFESDSRDIDILEAQVRNTLNGATPYDVSELAYDWSMTGGEVCVAAVAIETLTEAESFAVDHGFGPLSFVATPDAGAFQGEPFFGETVHAGEVLKAGESVERDEAAITIIGKLPSETPEAEPEPQAIAPEPETAIPPKEETVTPTVGFQSARTAPIEPSPPSEPKESAAPPEAPDTPSEEPAAPVMSFSSARRAPAPDPAPSTVLPESRFQSARPETQVDVEPPKTAPTAAEVESAPKPEPEPEPEPEVEANPAAPVAPPVADSPDPDIAAQAAPPEAQNRIPPAPALPAEFETVAAARADTLTEPAAPIRPTEKTSPPASKHPGRLPFLSSRKSDTAPRSSARPAAARSKKWNIPIGTGLKKARSVASGLRRKPEPSSAAQRSAVRTRADERERLTVFGERNPENVTTESNPRFLALAVTAGLLLLLVGIAAWAALTLEGGLSSLFRSSEDVQIAEEPAAIETPAELPAEDDTPIAALPQDPPRDTEDLADEPLFTLQPDQAISEELSPDEVRTRYAATGIWQRSPEQSNAPIELLFQDVYQTSLDPDVNFSDAVALPNVAAFSPGQRPATPEDPLRPGEDGLERDDRGFVIGTAEGVVTLDGITIFSGPPPILPPATPERPETLPEPQVAETETPAETVDEPETAVEPDAVAEAETAVEPEALAEAETAVEPEALAEAETATEPEAVAEAETPAEPEALAEAETTVEPEAVAEAEAEPEAEPETLADAETEAETETAVTEEPPLVTAGLRPRPRPDNITDSFERTNNGGRTLNELQTIRPRTRPQSAQEQALADAGISPEIEDDAETVSEDATDEAVAISLKPRPRPAGFANLVEETRETAASEPVSIEQRVAVSIPTTASVARAATERNQISLRRMNLIGVYGSADSRRALVRLPNGRYRKVKVGDKLDGGQVAAIGSDELRYIKRGQSLVLKMPSG